MKYAIAVLTMLGASVFMGGVAQAEEDPPTRTGCCFSFVNSPVNVIFCAVPDSCKFSTPPKELK